MLSVECQCVDTQIQKRLLKVSRVLMCYALYFLTQHHPLVTVSLCLPASSYLHGATIPVDGGMTIRHT